MTTEIPVQHFIDVKAWETFLARNHASSKGVWVKLAKKSAIEGALTYSEALDVALCFGWIDGQKKRFDEAFWLQKFTPRGQKSIWSKINREKADVLIKSGRMKSPGLAAIEMAKQDGRWAAAYDSQKTAAPPPDFQVELDKNPDAASFFSRLDSGNRYAILFRIQTAKKPETRARRIHDFVAMLKRGEKLHP